MHLRMKMMKLNSIVRRDCFSCYFRPLAATLALGTGLLVAHPVAAQRPERPALDISAYVIDAEIDTTAHHLKAKATVTFTAPDNAEMVSFGFHPALKVNKITDDSGKVL